MLLPGELPVDDLQQTLQHRGVHARAPRVEEVEILVQNLDEQRQGIAAAGVTAHRRRLHAARDLERLLEARHHRRRVPRGAGRILGTPEEMRAIRDGAHLVGLLEQPRAVRGGLVHEGLARFGGETHALVQSPGDARESASLRRRVRDLILVDGHRLFKKLVSDGLHPGRVRQERRLQKEAHGGLVSRHRRVRQRGDGLVKKLENLFQRRAHRASRRSFLASLGVRSILPRPRDKRTAQSHGLVRERRERVPQPSRAALSEMLPRRHQQSVLRVAVVRTRGVHQPRHQVLLLLEILVVHVVARTHPAFPVFDEDRDEPEQSLRLRRVGDGGVGGANDRLDDGSRHPP